MGENLDGSSHKGRLEAAAWWVELDSSASLTQARRKAWLEWYSRPANRRAYEEVAEVCMCLRKLERPADATAEELRASKSKSTIRSRIFCGMRTGLQASSKDRRKRHSGGGRS